MDSWKNDLTSLDLRLIDCVPSLNLTGSAPAGAAPLVGAASGVQRVVGVIASQGTHSG